jgi:methyl-accepting chemotaxis protein
MADFLQAELDEITFEVDKLIELAQQKAEKLKRVREMMDEFTDMVEEIE